MVIKTNGYVINNVYIGGNSEDFSDKLLVATSVEGALWFYGLYKRTDVSAINAAMHETPARVIIPVVGWQVVSK